MDYISDDLSVSLHQTPLFIQQANNTEIFCNVSKILVDFLLVRLGSNHECENAEKDNQESNVDTQNYEDKFIADIRAKGKDYCTQEEAQISLQCLVQNILDFDWGYLVNELYKISNTLQQDYSCIAGIKSVADWLSDSHESYFAEIVFKEEAYEVREKVEIEDNSVLGSILGRSKVEYKPIKKYRKVVSSNTSNSAYPMSCFFD